MWKYISRGLRETFERNVRGSLHKDGTVGTCDPVGQQRTCYFRKAATSLNQAPALYQSRFQGASKCGCDDQEETKQRKRQGTAYHSSCEGWFGAFRASSFLALGWILSHPCFWRKLDYLNDRQTWGNSPLLVNVLNKPVLANPIVEDDRPSYTVQLCSDVPDGSSLTSRQSSSSASSSKETFDKAAEDFKAVHNSILAEVENRRGVDLISTDSFEALRLFASATQRGYGPAAFNMAQCFELGVGTKQNFEEAALWYQRAVDLGHPTAMYNLGVFYAHGWGGLKASNRKARQLFQRAARQGQPDAMSALGMTPPASSPVEMSSLNSETDESHQDDSNNVDEFSAYSNPENPVVNRLSQKLYNMMSEFASIEFKARVTTLDAASFISDVFGPKGQERKRRTEHEVPACCVE